MNFFTADSHFSNKDYSVLDRDFRPFETLEEMNNGIIKIWNEQAGENDTIYHLGDFGNYEMIKRLNGKVVLVCGNYEELDYGNDFDGFRKKLLDLGFYQNGIYLDESVVGERLYLTHRPTAHADDCMTLFGHVHTLAPLKTFGCNVCVTYHSFAPVSVSQLRRYLDFIKNLLDKDCLC